MKKYVVNLLKYLIAFALIALSIKLFLQPQDLQLLADIKLNEYIILVLVTFLIYLVSGIGFALAVKANTKVSLHLSDILLLPISMNLWSFIIPFQGAVIYSTLLLKYKYKTAFTGAVSTTLFAYLLAVCMTGFIGLLLLILNDNIISIFTIVCLGLLFSPLVFLGLDIFCSRILDKSNWVYKYIYHLKSIINDIANLLKDRSTVLRIIGIDFVHLVLSISLNLLIVKFLELDLSFSFILLFTLFIRLSVILKVTPGNVGVQELLSGGIFSAFALDPAQGVLITLASRIVSLILMCSLGVIDTFLNLKYIKRQ